MAQYGTLQSIEPFKRGAAVTLSDVTTYADVVAIYVGGAGNLALTGKDDVDFTLNGLAAGSVVRVSPKIMKATGSTATNIVALYY